MNRSQPYEQIIQKGIEYSINEEENTASITGYKDYATKIIIPRAINHKSKEYIVTTISRKAFSISTIESVEFEANSELRTIERNVFFFSELSSIKIPASVVKLKCGWCCNTKNFYHVEVEAGNAVYASVGGKCIIGKSDISKEDYDILVFLARDTVEATIPKTIKIIGSYAFSGTKLASIEIPSHVTQICEGAFNGCKQLERVEFASNSELQTIRRGAFSGTKLASIEIPSHVTKICEGAFYNCYQLERVEFETNSELQTIGKEAFSHSALASIQIPSHVTHINECAFLSCWQLQIVEIEENSVYESIYKNRFDKSKIITLPIKKKLH